LPWITGLMGHRCWCCGSVWSTARAPGLAAARAVSALASATGRWGSGVVAGSDECCAVSVSVSASGSRSGFGRPVDPHDPTSSGHSCLNRFSRTRARVVCSRPT
jgi:hypothetical protein